MTPVIVAEQSAWIIVRPTSSTTQRDTGRQFDWCWTREGWAPATGTALKFETRQSARKYLNENLHLLRSTPVS